MAEESKIKAFLETLREKSKGAGYSDERTGERHYTPWAWRTPDSIYCGWDGSVWVYRSIDMPPWTWSDPADRMKYGSRLSEIFSDLVGVTPDSVLPQQMAKTTREFHVVSTTWWEPARSPNDDKAALYEYQAAALKGLTAPRRSLLIGVRLRAKGRSQAQAGSSGLGASIQAMALQVLGEDTPDLSVYGQDLVDVTSILKRAGGKIPTRTEQYQLESWYNFGRGPEARVIEEWDHLLIENFDQIQFAAVSDFHRPILTAPYATWILDALNHPQGPHVVSIRGSITPPRMARNRARSAIRWARDQADQEAKSGDVGRREVDDVYELATILDDHFAETRFPLLSDVSVIFGRRVRQATETYVEDLRNRYDIEVTPLLGRQIAALEETLPCSSKRVNPYPQELSTEMISFSGINSFSELGDSKGVLIGVTAEDGVPIYLDPLGAPKANQPATMFVAGDSGGGKTFLLQNISVQAALSGLPVVFINPKGQDTLATMAELVGGEVISMSRIEEEGGFFDAFRFTDPETAADISATFLLSVITELNERQQLMLRHGLRKGALQHGARCVGEALRYVEDPEAKEMVQLAAENEPRVGLGVSWVPVDEFEANKRLLLIEFDKGLDLPAPGAKPETMSQRAALAAMQHVVRVSLEMMAGRTGGVLIVDEAWTFLEQASARDALEGLGRKGRSLNVLPILASQKVADLLKYDMSSLLSRVLCLSMRDPEEAEAALKLAGLEPNVGRVQFLQDCGPRRLENGQTRIPMAVHRDLQNRHGVIVLGPIPKRAIEAFSTNPEDRARREAAIAAAEAASAQAVEGLEFGEEGLTEKERFTAPYGRTTRAEGWAQTIGDSKEVAEETDVATEIKAVQAQYERVVQAEAATAPSGADISDFGVEPLGSGTANPEDSSGAADDGGWQTVDRRGGRRNKSRG